MKKSNRYLIAFGLLAMVLVSWYMLIQHTVEKKAQYQSTLKEARRLADLKIYEDAKEYYDQAYQIQPSYTLGLEIAQFYIDSEDEVGFEDYMETFISNNRERPEGYEFLMDYYFKKEEYLTCVEWIKKAENNQIKTKKISEVESSLAKKYFIQYGQYADVKKFCGDTCAVKSENSGLWGYISDTGRGVLNLNYKQANGFLTNSYASVMNQEGEFFLIDRDGYRREADSEKRTIEDGTMLINDLMAIKVNGKYTFVHTDFSKGFGSYDDAGVFNGTVAPVKEGEKWYIIDNTGKKVSSEGYDEIVRDELGISFRQERGFALQGKKYILIDTSGKQIGTDSYDAAVTFSKQGYAAVKVKKKWGFINTDGKFVIEPKYDGARSFSNGFAAVAKGGKWGYIDENEEQIVDYEYDGAMDFSEKKSCFVKAGNSWNLLIFYL